MVLEDISKKIIKGSLITSKYVEKKQLKQAPLKKKIQVKFNRVHKWVQKQIEPMNCSKYYEKFTGKNGFLYDDDKDLKKSYRVYKDKSIIIMDSEDEDDYSNFRMYDFDVNNSITNQNKNKCFLCEPKLKQNMSFASLFSNLDLFLQEIQSVNTSIGSEDETFNDYDEQSFTVDFSNDSVDSTTLNENGTIRF